MDHERFDEITRMLGFQITRRGALGLLAGLTGLHLGEAAADAKGRQRRRGAGRNRGRVAAEAKPGNSECAWFCKEVFPPGPGRGRCIRDAAHGEGLCHECGADPDLACEQADGSHICCASASDVCGEGSCTGTGGDGGDGGGCASSCPTLDTLQPCGALDRSGCALPPLECGTCGADETCQQIGICGRFCCPPQGCSFSGPGGSHPCFPGCTGATCGGVTPGEGSGGPGPGCGDPAGPDGCGPAPGGSGGSGGAGPAPAP